MPSGPQIRDILDTSNCADGCLDVIDDLWFDSVEYAA